MSNILKIETGRIFTRTRKLFDDGKKVVIHQGGSGSGKTYDVMMFLFYNILLNPNQKNKIITVVSESRPHLEIGVVRYLTKFATDIDMFNVSNWNKSKLLFTNPSNGNVLEFFSADRIEKALGARRDWLFGNEVNSLKLDIWEELARRSENIIADFNPTSQFWLENWLLNYADTEIVKSNHTWNKFLPDTERERILRRASRDANFRRIHIDCEYGISEGVVFSNWQQVDEMPDGNYIYGLDYGFSNDPTAMVKVLETPEAFYLDEMIYQTGMLNSQIIKRLEDLNIEKRYDEIIADSAEPKSIQEIHNAGFNIKGAVKGADSIRAGIDRLQSKPIYVTKRSTNLIKELRNYCWVTDKDGRPTNKPIDDYNHLIDATRYAISPKNNFKFHIA